MGNWLILPFLLLLCFLTGNVLQYITKEEKENRHLHPVLLGAVLWMCCAGSSVFLQNFTMVYRLFACLVLAVMGLGVLFFVLPSYRRFTARQFVWKEKGGNAHEMSILWKP